MLHGVRFFRCNFEIKETRTMKYITVETIVKKIFKYGVSFFNLYKIGDTKIMFLNYF